MMDYDVYNLREINKKPPTDNDWFSFKSVKRDKYRLGRVMVNGQPKVYRREKRSIDSLMGDMSRGFSGFNLGK